MSKNTLVYNVWSEESLDFSEIEKNKPEKIIIFAGHEWQIGGNDWHDEDYVRELGDLIVRNNIKLIIVLGGADISSHDLCNILLPKSNTEIILWSSFLLHMTYSFINFDLFDNKKECLPEKLFILLNDRPHRHRCELIDNIFKEGLNEYGYFSWISTIKELKMTSPDYKFKYWEPKQTILDEDYLKVGKNPYLSVPDEQFKTLVNVIPESTISVPFITEKTYLAIMYKKPFIILGGKNTHKLLTDYGFLLYDEIFDYSFDGFDRYEDRIDGIIQNLNNLKNSNYYELQEKIKPKVEYNEKNMHNITKNKKYIPEEVKNLREYINKMYDVIF